MSEKNNFDEKIGKININKDTFYDVLLKIQKTGKYLTK